MGVDREAAGTTEPTDLRRVEVPGHNAFENAGKTPRVLFVDDEELVCCSARAVFVALGLEVTVAHSADAAIAYYSENTAEVDLAVVDLSMPGIDGRSCIRLLRRVNPDIKVLLTTGHATPELARSVSQEGVTGLVPKPFGVTELAEAIAEALCDRTFLAPLQRMQ